MQAVAGNSLSNNALLGKNVIVRPLEKVLGRMRIADQVRPMRSQFRTQVRAGPSGKPERISGHCRIWPPDHLEFKIGSDIFQSDRWMDAKIIRSKTTFLLAAK